MTPDVLTPPPPSIVEFEIRVHGPQVLPKPLNVAEQSAGPVSVQALEGRQQAPRHAFTGEQAVPEPLNVRPPPVHRDCIITLHALLISQQAPRIQVEQS